MPTKAKTIPISETLTGTVVKGRVRVNSKWVPGACKMLVVDVPMCLMYIKMQAIDCEVDQTIYCCGDTRRFPARDVALSEIVN